MQVDGTNRLPASLGIPWCYRGGSRMRGRDSDDGGAEEMSRSKSAYKACHQSLQGWSSLVDGIAGVTLRPLGSHFTRVAFLRVAKIESEDSWGELYRCSLR